VATKIKRIDSVLEPAGQALKLPEEMQPSPTL
jgi:hypothetical protein